MSSYYTTAQLEEMRKARLKQELSDSIQKLKEQLQTEYANHAQVMAGANMEAAVFVMDAAVGGYHKNTAVTGAMLQTEDTWVGNQRDELDFSGLLPAARKKPTRLEQELDSWVRRVEERPIVTEKDEQDRVRLLAELAKTMQDSAADMEDKLRAVRMRVSTYLGGAAAVTDADRERINAVYWEYCALCKLLNVPPTETLPYRVEREAARMASVLEKRRQDEYVMDVIEEIMEDLGCHARDDAILDHTDGQIYAVDGHPLCDVFIGNDGSGIMFEPIGESRGGSLEQQRQMESSANSICSLYAALEERAAEKGVVLRRVYMEPAHLDEMCVQSDIREGSAGKKQRKASAQKQRALHWEG